MLKFSTLLPPTGEKGALITQQIFHGLARPIKN